MPTLAWRRSLLGLCLLLGAAARAAEPEATPLDLTVGSRHTKALLTRPAEARALLVVGQGPTTNIRSPFMTSLATSLAAEHVATLRFDFPYAETGAGKPDPFPVMLDTVREAVREGAERRGGLPLLLAGQSLSSLVVVQALAGGLEPVAGAVMIGFPLHQPGRPSARNARGLDAIPVPILFVQGSRDPLADLGLMRGLVEQLGPRARLHVVWDGGHQLEPSPESGRPAEQLIQEAVGAIAGFAATLGGSSGG